MSFRENLSTASDVSEIIAVAQRAELLANQRAQTEALDDLRSQSETQAKMDRRQKELQNTLFALSQSVTRIEREMSSSPDQAAAELMVAAKAIALLHPSIFLDLAWKNMAVEVEAKIQHLSAEMNRQHNEILVQQRAEFEDSELAVREADRQRLQEARNESARLRAATYRTEKRKEKILIGVAVVFVFAMVVLAVWVLR